MKAVREDAYVNKPGCVPIKLYLQRKWVELSLWAILCPPWLKVWIGKKTAGEWTDKNQYLFFGVCLHREKKKVTRTFCKKKKNVEGSSRI